MIRRFLGFLLAAACLGSPAPAPAADPAKTLRIAFQEAESTFDPALFQDIYSTMVAENIYDSMLTYDYLARPAKLVPQTLETMPELSPDGRTYTFRLRKGIYFTPDPAFGGRPRELVAADYAYSILRFYDPKVKSPNLYLVEDKIAGLDEAMERAKASGKFDYDARYEGLQVLDRYTLRVRLKRTDYTFLFNMAIVQFGAVAREVVEYYGDDFGNHPVGTGPYVLSQWTRAHRMVLEANPAFRELRDADGRKLPLIGRVEIFVIQENQPRWLAFVNGEHDLIQWVPPQYINTVAPEGRLAPYLAKKGVRMVKEVPPRVAYTYFNFDDPTIGGYEPQQVALRRAISLAYDMPQEIRVLRKHQAIQAQGPIPPGVSGYDPAFRSPTVEFDPARAKALLDMFGFVDRDGDGYRERPDGSPLVLELGSRPDLESREYAELWKKCMDEIGVRITFKRAPWPDLLKESLAGKLQMWTLSWQSASPDGDFFMGLFYGPNSGKSNDSHFRFAEYDRLYEQSRVLPDSPERTRLYQEMTKLILAYAPWVFHVHHLNTHLMYRWVKGYKKHPFVNTQWRYLDLDLDERRRAGIR